MKQTKTKHAKVVTPELINALESTPHVSKTSHHHSHKRLHSHHKSMPYFAAAGMTALGLLLLVGFNPASQTMLQAPSGSISEDVSKIMPALEPDLDGFTDPGVSTDELDETVMGK